VGRAGARGEGVYGGVRGVDEGNGTVVVPPVVLEQRGQGEWRIQAVITDPGDYELQVRGRGPPMINDGNDDDYVHDDDGGDDAYGDVVDDANQGVLPTVPCYSRCRSWWRI
jgi:hypothetical protein